MSENKEKNTDETIKKTDELLRRIELENTHQYWTVLILTKKDNPNIRKIKLESHYYTLPDIKYKDKEDYKKLVVKEFNDKLVEKYKHKTDYEISPIILPNLYLTREKAEKVKNKTIEKDKIASSKSKKKK